MVAENYFALGARGIKEDTLEWMEGQMAHALKVFNPGNNLPYTQDVCRAFGIRKETSPILWKLVHTVRVYAKHKDFDINEISLKWVTTTLPQESVFCMYADFANWSGDRFEGRFIGPVKFAKFLFAAMS